MKRLLLVILASAACAGNPNQTQHPGQGSGSGSGSNVQCTEVTDTGSMFSHTECKPIEEKQAEHDDTQRLLTKPRSQPTGTHY